MCWCRKPWLGLPVALARRHGVALASCLVAASSSADRQVAEKLGVPAFTDPESLAAALGRRPRRMGG